MMPEQFSCMIKNKYNHVCKSLFRFFVKIVRGIAEFPAFGVMTAFGPNVHKDMTKQLAVGHSDTSASKHSIPRLFTNTEADGIAKSCNGVDKKVEQVGGWSAYGSQMNANEHYMTDIEENRIFFLLSAERRIRRLFCRACKLMDSYRTKMVSASAQDQLSATYDLSRALIAFGEGLHTYQDRFSHTKDGYPITDVEHGWVTSPDGDEKKKQEAEKQTWYVLTKMSEIKNYGCMFGRTCSTCSYWNETKNPIADNHKGENPPLVVYYDFSEEATNSFGYRVFKVYKTKTNRFPGLKGDIIRGKEAFSDWKEEMIDNIEIRWSKFVD